MQNQPLPETISDEVFAMLTRAENAAFIDQQAARYHLDEGEVASLSATIGRAMMGTVPLSALADTLEEEIGFEKEEACELALTILLELFYPFWPLFPQIDDAIRRFGGVVPKEKPARPVIQGRRHEGAMPIAYPTATPRTETLELFGGDIPVPPPPPMPRMQSGQGVGFRGQGMGERDIPWKPGPQPSTLNPDSQVAQSNEIEDPRRSRDPQPSRNVARPGEVARLLDANIIKKPENTEPRIDKNVVDLSQ